MIFIINIKYKSSIVFTKNYLCLPSSLFSSKKNCIFLIFQAVKFHTCKILYIYKIFQLSFFTSSQCFVFYMCMCKPTLHIVLCYGHSTASEVPKHLSRTDLLSTQRAAAKLLDDSGGAAPAQTQVAARQSDSGLSSHAHHAFRWTAFVCDRNREITVTRLTSERAMFEFSTNTYKHILLHLSG